MAFNSNTYHRNRCQRDAAESLAKARAIKARIATGEAYDWEVPLIASHAKMARCYARMARSFEALRQIKASRP